MTAECTRTKLRFQGLDGRDVVGRFDGGEITSDAGGVLLREVEQRTRILGRLSECFTDYRDSDRVEHPVEALIKQRVLGLCLGYEDLNDHDELCRDRLLALLCDRDDLTGEFRRVESDRGKPLAGKSTLNRLERTPLEGPEGAYKKIVADPAGMDELLLEVFVEAHPEPPEEVILDVDATDDPLHGKQEGRFFHGYYKRYCYLPLYVFCGEHLLRARLRTADRGAAHGVVAELEPIVRRLREAWPQVRILVRGDSAFSNDELMVWCEKEGIDYVLGLAQNDRLKRRIATRMETVRQLQRAIGKAVRQFQELRYQTRDTWSCERRVVAKVEHLPRGKNPRFIVTSVPVQECDGRRLYEDGCGVPGAGAAGGAGGLLRAGRHGESDKGTADGSVCGPHVDPEAGGESTAVVFLGVRLRDDGDVATGGTGGDEAGAGAELDPAGEIAEDRGTGPDHQPQGLVVLFRELSVCGAVEDGSDASASPPASLLATDGKNSLDDGDLGVPRMDCAPEWAPGRESSLRSAGWASKGSGEALHLAVGRHVRARKLPLELVWIKNHPDDGSTSVYCSTDEKCRLAETPSASWIGAQKEIPRQEWRN